MPLATMLDSQDRGLQYGDGLFETLRVVNGHAPLFERHRARLEQGVRRLALPVPTAQLRQRLADAVAACEPGDRILKVILTRGASGRGYAPPGQARPQWVVRESAFVPRDPRCYQSGLVTGLCSQRLADQPVLAGIKHLNRLEQVLAAAEVQAHGWDEGLVLDNLGRPAEWTSMNLFARFGETLWTPPVHRCGVAGVLRGWLLEQWLPTSGLSASSRPLSLAELHHADEVFAGNSVAGFLPVRKLAVWQWETPQLSLSLQHTFSGLFSR